MENQSRISVFSSVLMESSEEEILHRARSESQPLPRFLRHYTSIRGRRGIVDIKRIRMSSEGAFGPGVYLTDLFTPDEPNQGLQWIADTLQIPPREGQFYCVRKCYSFIDLKVEKSMRIELRLRNDKLGEPVIEFFIDELDLKEDENERYLDTREIAILSGSFAIVHRNSNE